MDTTRADYLGCYGHSFIKTPNIDSFAKESILFRQHIVTASSTLASHTSLLTGTYPHTHGVARNGYFINKKNIMLAETLKKNGFKTAAFIGSIMLDKQFLFNQGFDEFDTDFKLIVRKHKIPVFQRRAKDVTNKVLGWVDKKKKGDERNHKNFLFIHYFDPHLPYDAPPPYRGMYRKPGTSFDYSANAMNIAIKTRSVLQKADREEIEKIVCNYNAEYCAEITYCDYHIGRLLEGLKERGLYDNSLIILTADHGETMDEHFSMINHSLTVYDTEIRVPLIVKFPGGEFGGQETSRLVSNIDIVPTINHLLGIRDNENIEGQSFARIIDGPLSPRDPVFSEATAPHWLEEFSNDPLWPNRKKYQCIRTERYKYMLRTTDNRYEFYDLKTDPMEQDNLLKDKKRYNVDIVSSMKKQLVEWSNSVNLVSSSQMTESKEAIKALESLGYVSN